MKPLDTISQTFRVSARAQFIGRVALSMLAVWIDFQAAPSVRSSRPFLALAAFALLILFSNKSRQAVPGLPRLSSARLVVFALLHLLIVLLGNHFAASLSWLGQSYSLTSSAIAALKVLVVAPSAALFVNASFVRRYSAETVAGAIALFTFFPVRIFHTVWPWYSRVLTQGLTWLCSMFVPGTYLSRTAEGATVAGPSINMAVDFSCSGITGINLFHLVFGFVVLLEWNHLYKRRTVVCFLLGGVAYIISNFLRLALLFLIGNLVSPNLNLDFLGWVLFAITFYVLMKLTYDWIVLPERYADPVSVLAQQNGRKNVGP